MTVEADYQSVGYGVYSGTTKKNVYRLFFIENKPQANPIAAPRTRYPLKTDLFGFRGGAIGYKGFDCKKGSDQESDKIIDNQVTVTNS